MGILKNLISGIGENKKEYKQKFKEAEQDLKVEHTLQERQKSSNQRELERYMKEEQEAQIEQALEKIHKKQNSSMWKSNYFLGKGATMMKNDRPILMEKNIFLDNKTKIPKPKGRIYFK